MLLELTFRHTANRLYEEHPDTYRTFIQNEYNKIYRTAYCPKCGQNLDEHPITLTEDEATTPGGTPVKRILCPDCDGPEEGVSQ